MSMRKKTSTFQLLLLIISALGIPFLVASDGQIPIERSAVVEETGNDCKKKENGQIDDFRKSFPVVQFSDDQISDPVRKNRSKKYGKIPIVDPNIVGNETEVSTFHWEEGLSPLPVDKSHVVLVGTVLDAKAYLSDNKMSVYSEFTINIETIYDNRTSAELIVGSTITAEREGGIVRFSTGFEKWFFLSGQSMPLVQHRYLFFLSNNFPGLSPQNTDLTILTAYEYKGGRIVPLDSPGGGTHPIATFYRGKETSVLASDLDRVLSRNRPKGDKR